MFKFVLVILFLGLSIERIAGDALPSNIQKCNHGDDKCFSDVYRKVVSDFASIGNKDLGLDVIEPLVIDDVKNKRDPNNPVNIQLEVKNIKMYGLSKLRISKLSKALSKVFDGKQVDLTLKVPSTSLVGDYKLDGKVLILPIQGLGRCNLTLVKPTINLVFTGKSEIIGGEEYMKLEKVKIKYTTKGAIIYLENLFNGDKALGEAMNKFLNENWKILYDELTPAFFKSVDKRITEIIQSVMYKIPYKDLFLD